MIHIEIKPIPFVVYAIVLLSFAGFGMYHMFFERHHVPVMGTSFSKTGHATDTPVVWPSIPEMQEWCGAEVDGIFGPETNRLYGLKWAEQYGNQCSLELWEQE